MESNDFIVKLHERYDMTPDELINTINALNSTSFKYEDKIGWKSRPNIDYNKLFVGARLYVLEDDFTKINVDFVEIEITHIYGGIIFFKYLEGQNCGKEDWMPENSYRFMFYLYPKCVIIPNNTTFTCNCPKVKFINY